MPPVYGYVPGRPPVPGYGVCTRVCTLVSVSDGSVPALAGTSRYVRFCAVSSTYVRFVRFCTWPAAPLSVSYGYVLGPAMDLDTAGRIMLPVPGFPAPEARRGPVGTAPFPQGPRGPVGAWWARWGVLRTHWSAVNAAGPPRVSGGVCRGFWRLFYAAGLVLVGWCRVSAGQGLVGPGGGSVCKVTER